jgi:hypothetical protein
MAKHILTFIAIVLFVSACNLLSPSLETTWHITKIEPIAQDKESESIFTDAYLSFYDDGAASFFNKNEHDKSLGQPLYRLGEWIRDGDALKVSLKKTMIDVTFNIVELTDKWLVLEITQGPKETIGTLLKCQPSDAYRSKSFDLLSPVNNTWRTAPAHKESRAAVKSRVVNHLDFLLGYFKMVDDKSQDYFETGILQTPFGFYSNGIAIPNEFEMDNKWLPYFFDEEDAKLGGKMLLQGLGSIDEYPADEKSFTKGYYKALRLIKEHVEK